MWSIMYRTCKANVVSLILTLGLLPIGIKAKTPEGTGTGNAAIAHVAVLLTEIMWP